MNGTVTPSVVVAVSIWSSRGRVLRVVRLEGAAVVVRVDARDRRAVPRTRPWGGRRTCRTPSGCTFRPSRRPGTSRAGSAGPENTGPPIGWLITNRRAALPRRMRAVSATRPTLQAAHAAVQAPRAGAAEHARHVPVPRHEPEPRAADPARQRHAHERVAAGHQVGAVRQHLDPRRGHARLRRRRSEQHARARGKGKSCTKSASHRWALYQKASPGGAGLAPFRRPPLVAWCRQGRRRPA